MAHRAKDAGVDTIVVLDTHSVG
ncbi:hypothetical protein [Marinomonas alcarazii]